MGRRNGTYVLDGTGERGFGTGGFRAEESVHDDDGRGIGISRIWWWKIDGLVGDVNNGWRERVRRPEMTSGVAHGRRGLASLLGKSVACAYIFYFLEFNGNSLLILLFK